MITGLHAIIYANDAERVRAFLHDVLGLKSVDAGRLADLCRAAG